MRGKPAAALSSVSFPVTRGKEGWGVGVVWAEFWGGVQATFLAGNVSSLLVGQSVSPVKWKY